MKKYTTEEILALIDGATPGFGMAAFTSAAPTIIRQLLAEREAFREVAIHFRRESRWGGSPENEVDAEVHRLIEAKENLNAKEHAERLNSEKAK